MWDLIHQFKQCAPQTVNQQLSWPKYVFLPWAYRVIATGFVAQMMYSLLTLGLPRFFYSASCAASIYISHHIQYSWPMPNFRVNYLQVKFGSAYSLELSPNHSIHLTPKPFPLYVPIYRGKASVEGRHVGTRKWSKRATTLNARWFSGW